MQKAWVQSLGWERKTGKRNGNALQYSCLGNPMDRGVWQATVYGVTESWTQLSDKTITNQSINNLIKFIKLRFIELINYLIKICWIHQRLLQSHQQQTLLVRCATTLLPAPPIAVVGVGWRERNSCARGLWFTSPAGWVPCFSASGFLRNCVGSCLTAWKYRRVTAQRQPSSPRKGVRGKRQGALLQRDSEYLLQSCSESPAGLRPQRGGAQEALFPAFPPPSLLWRPCCSVSQSCPMLCDPMGHPWVIF